MNAPSTTRSIKSRKASAAHQGDHTAIVEIPVREIFRNVDQPREAFPEDHIRSLGASIAARGLIQPIIVRKIGNHYQIVAGECRFRAHLLLERETIPAIVIDISKQEMQLRAIVENIQRRDMNPIEEAKAYQTLIDNGYSAAKITTELGLKSVSIVQSRLSLLSLTDEIQSLVRTGNLNVSMATGIALAPHEAQTKILRDISSGKHKTAEQVRLAGQSARDLLNQVDFLADAPRATEKELASLTRLEAKVEQIVSMIAEGFKDGECVAARKVSPDRVNDMVQKMKMIRSALIRMEYQLEKAATQTSMQIEAANESQSPSLHH